MATSYRNGTVGEALQMRYSTDRAFSGLFVQCKIYDINDTLQYTVNLTESVSLAGRYIGNVTVNTEGDYEAFYVPYTDAGHTIESDIAPRSSEALRITLTEAKFGGVTLPPSGGITDNDIQAIIDGVSKNIGVQEQNNPWEYTLPNGRTVLQELLAKSEFDPKRDTVEKVDTTKLSRELSNEIRNSFFLFKSFVAPLFNELKSMVKNLNLVDKLSKDLGKIAKKLDSSFENDSEIIRTLIGVRNEVSRAYPQLNSISEELSVRSSELFNTSKQILSVVDKMSKIDSVILTHDSTSAQRTEILLNEMRSSFEDIATAMKDIEDSIYGLEV